MGRILTLSGPAVTVSNVEIFTRVELHTFRGSTGKTEDDPRLDQLVEGINRAAFDVLRQRFIKATGTPFDIVMDGPLGDSIQLPHYPIVSLTSLNRGHYDTGGWVNDYTYLTTDYVQEDEIGRITVVGGQPFPHGRRQMRAIYTGGFAIIPHDIKVAAMAWAAIEYARAAGNRQDIISVGVSAYTFDTMPLASKTVFKRYMRKDQIV